MEGFVLNDGKEEENMAAENRIEVIDGAWWLPSYVFRYGLHVQLQDHPYSYDCPYV